MKPVKRVLLRDVEQFIRKKLKSNLRQDLRELRIIKEADLECSSYFYLRRFIGKDHRWRILARKHVKRTGHYIDMLIFRKGIPRIAIEFKWRHKKISGKDRRSLVASLKKLGVNKAYFFSALPDRSKYVRMEKKSAEKYSFHECVVGLDFTRTETKTWERERQKYTAKMKRGRAHH